MTGKLVHGTMGYMGRWQHNVWLALVGCSVVGCGVERIGDATTGSPGVPPEVQAVLDESCSCHTQSNQTPVLDPEGSYIGTQVLIPGDLENSQIAAQIRMGLMPPPGSPPLTEEGRLILFGWIAQLGLDTGGEAPTGTTGSGSSSTGAEDSSTSLGSSTGTSDPYEAFVPVLEVLRARCSGTGCHRDGGANPPVMEDDVAYDNLLGEVATMSGVAYVEPNDPSASYVVTRLTDPVSPMPPVAATALTQEQIDTIIGWIEAGAQR